MSRHDLTPKEPHIMTIVGWDAPLGTFFFQAFDDVADDEPDEPVVWIGTTPGEIFDATTLIEQIRAHADIPADLVEKLAADRENAPPDFNRPAYVFGLVTN